MGLSGVPRFGYLSLSPGWEGGCSKGHLEEEEEKGTENLFKEIMTKTFCLMVDCFRTFLNLGLGRSERTQLMMGSCVCVVI